MHCAARSHVINTYTAHPCGTCSKNRGMPKTTPRFQIGIPMHALVLHTRTKLLCKHGDHACMQCIHYSLCLSLSSLPKYMHDLLACSKVSSINYRKVAGMCEGGKIDPKSWNNLDVNVSPTCQQYAHVNINDVIILI